MKIADLVNKVDTFRFEYDGFVLEGEYYKYKTTTPNYAKEGLTNLPEVPEEGTDEEKKAAQLKRDEALSKFYDKTLADTIKSWNATDEGGNPVPPSIETFSQLPMPFTTAFAGFLRELRENPTSPNLPSTS